VVFRLNLGSPNCVPDNVTFSIFQQSKHPKFLFLCFFKPYIVFYFSLHIILAFFPFFFLRSGFPVLFYIK
jgi:hypothetical protein